MRSTILCFFAALWIAAAVSAEAVGTDVLIGYFAGDAAQSPRRVDMGSTTSYRLVPATVPVDRQLVRSSKVIYIDQFPEGAEFFRDDMEAFHYMVHEGGVLVLVAGPDSSLQTKTNFNYLGKRFDFDLGETAPSGSAVPSFPLQGPLGGNVWGLEQGALGVRLGSPEWRVWFRHSDTGEPVAASRAIGKGLLVLLGTHELERQEEGHALNALSLVDWSLRELASPSPQLLPPPSPEATFVHAAPPGDAESSSPGASSGLLRDRIAELRRSQGIGANPAAKPLLIPRLDRQYLPFRPNISDIDGRMFSVPDYQGLVAVLVFWSTWDSASRAMLEQSAASIRQIEGQGVAVVGISLDRDVAAPKQWLERSGISMRLLCDGKGWRSTLVDVTETRRIPRIMVLDTAGRIAHADLHPADIPRAIGEARAER